MRRDWKIVRLEKAGQVVNGGTPKTNVAEYWDGEHLWVTPAEMGNKQTPYLAESRRKLTDAGLKNSSASLVPPQSIILSTRAPIGHLVINTAPMAFNQGCRALIPNPDMHYKYLFYFLLGNVELLNDLGTGTTFKELSATKLKNVSVPLPPLSEQKRIVAILDEAFAGIATAVANTEKNLANARELFESYLNSVFSQPGEGWIEQKISEVCELKSGTTVEKSAEQSAGDIAYVKVADMSFPGNEETILSSSRFLSFKDVRKNSVFPVGTTIFPKRGGAIATNKKRWTSIPICADLNIMGVIPTSVLLPKFLYFYFYQVDMRAIGGGASIPQINNYDIAPLVIPFPSSLEDQASIVTKLDELDNQTRQLEVIYQRKLTALAELKQSLLQKAFSGELTTEPEPLKEEEVA